MNRYLLWGTITAALTIFAWQTLSNTALGWHEATLRRFEDPDLIVAAINVAAPESGMYVHERGIVAAVSMVPGVTDKSALMGVALMRQVGVNLIAAFLLALVVRRLGMRPLPAAAMLAGVGLAAGIVLELSDWNWYGFPLAYTLVNAIDVAINIGLATLVLAWFAQRFDPDRGAAASEQPESLAA